MNQLQMINRMLWGGADTDAQAFIDATGITDSTIITAIFKLVADLKIANIWAKRKAIYPFVGGTAFTHKFNLKDPRDLDVAFRLVETGVNTHNSNGITMNGIDGRFDTKFIPNNEMTITNGLLSIYQRDNRVSRQVYDIGDGGFGVITKYTVGEAYFMYNGGFSATLAMPDSRGLFVTNRNGTNTEGYRNGAKVITKVQTANSLPMSSVKIGATSSGVAYSASNYAYASLGGMLTESENLTYYNIIQEFQTTLGREV